MTEVNENISQKQALEKLSAFVVEQIKAGNRKSDVSSKLVEMGMEKEQAEQFVEAIYAQTARYAETERFSVGSLTPAILGGVLAAAVGGAAWGLIIILTGYEIGYVAWGIGALAGFAVVLFTGGKKGLPLQVIATISSVAGIAVGKYVTFFHFLRETVAEQYGGEAASTVSFLSGSVFQFFVENSGSLLSPFDALWVVLAVITAWRIPRGIGFRPVE